MLRGIVQFDTLNEVNIRLSDGSKAFNYDGYTNIIFKVLKADGAAYIDSEGENVIATSPVDGIITVNLTGQSTTAAGLCQSVLEIYSGDGKMTTARFNYEVFENLDTNEAVESTTEYPALQNLMLDLSELEARITEAETARVTAEAARASEASGYVAKAQEAAKNAEMWAKAAQDIADGDYATRAELEAVEAGAAPAGYGLGETSGAIYRDANEIARTGFYRCNIGTPNEEWWYGLHIQYAEGYAYQEFSRTVVNHRVCRQQTGGIWGEWEWMNPPMISGAEYRTTERYLGRPVYAKLINAGTVEASSQISVPYAENVQYIVHADVYASAADQYNNEGVVFVAGARKSGVVLKNASTMNANNCLVHIKYTKTTDT